MMDGRELSLLRKGITGGGTMPTFFWVESELLAKEAIGAVATPFRRSGQLRSHKGDRALYGFTASSIATMLSGGTSAMMLWTC